MVTALFVSALSKEMQIAAEAAVNRMSMVRAFHVRGAPAGALGALAARRGFANDVTKASVAPPGSGAATSNPYEIDPVKVELPKPNVNIVITPPSVVTDVEIKRKQSSFDDIPGPVSLKTLARVWSMVPVVGTQITGAAIQYFLGSQLSWSGNMWVFKRLLDEYGPVVRLHGPFGGDVVILSKPEHIESVFKNEGPYPVRSSLDSVEKYRLQHKKYRNIGPFLMFGPEWERFRKAIEQPMQSILVQQSDKIDEVSDKFVVRLSGILNTQDEVPDAFLKELYKWSLECLCVMALDKKMGLLDPCGLSSTSDAYMLLEGLIGATDAIRRCEFGLHLWKFMNTPAWNSLVLNCDSIEKILGKYVKKIQDNLREKKETSHPLATASFCLFEKILLKDGMTVDDSMTILMDMMLIGVNATVHTVAFLMYHVAKYPRCQAKLHEEIRAHQSGKLTRETLRSMPYLQACIKETLRLKPPIPILGRVLQDDITVHNYLIPKGTYLLMTTSLASLREEYFENPQRFVPDRWLNATEEEHSFASVPFGYGAKSCLAKDLAEMQIGILAVKILSKYKIEYLYGDINSTNKLLASPNKKLKFRFTARP